MTRHQAAARLLKLVHLRDAREACQMGATALLDQPRFIAIGVCAGFCIGVVVGVLHG